MMPMKDVNPNPMGIVINCGSRASLAFEANLAKSGSLTMSVVKFETADIVPAITPHASLEPPTLAG